MDSALKVKFFVNLRKTDFSCLLEGILAISEISYYIFIFHGVHFGTKIPTKKEVKPRKSFWAMLLFYWVCVTGSKLCGWSDWKHHFSLLTLPPRKLLIWYKWNAGDTHTTETSLVKGFFFQTTCEGGRLLALSGGIQISSSQRRAMCIPFIFDCFVFSC